ncbi:MAG: NAD(P)/FAD-dependent oxidoreductase [Clostridia bacterium]|nr:NAD(P)/FAD-dependent oxidoreductase [Clostridia bacterium]
MKETKYLIIGNSAAGAWATKGIREVDPWGTITLVGAEDHPLYSRPLISYYLAGSISGDRLLYSPQGWIIGPAGEVITGRRVERLEVAGEGGGGVAYLNNGEAIAFRRLLLATGSTPASPPLPGRDLEGVFTFYTWDDARRIKEFIARHGVKRAVVVGGGLIGIKATEGLIGCGVKVTVIELADHILITTMDAKASSLIGEALEKAGCELLSRTAVAEIRGRGSHVEEVLLADGSVLPADLVILATGVRPRIDLAQAAGIKTRRGVVVNSRQETSLPGIYAAGDVAEVTDVVTGEVQPLALWPAATRQGYVAGINMAGGNQEYQGGLSMNSVEVAGVPAIAMGVTKLTGVIDQSGGGGSFAADGQIEVLESYQPQKMAYRKVVLCDNRVIGAILVGKIERAGIYLGLIREGIDASDFKEHLLREDFGFIFLPKQYRKHLVSGSGMEV